MKKSLLVVIAMLVYLTGCTYNPFSSNNQLTGNATGTAIGAVAGVGGAALLGLPKPLIFLAGLGGGAIGYYATTLRFQSGGIIQSGGQVYTVGDNIGIYIATDRLFEPNTADFLPQAIPILNSAATVLKRYPNNHIIISGDTSGFSRPRWENALSLQRAQRVAAFLWDAGVTQSSETGIRSHRLTYVGYGDYLPIASDETNWGIRKNSRIQITSYPPKAALIDDGRGCEESRRGSCDSHCPCPSN